MMKRIGLCLTLHISACTLESGRDTETTQDITETSVEAVNFADLSSQQPVSIASVLSRARKAADAGEPAVQIYRSSEQRVWTDSVLGIDNLYCYAPNYWQCVGDTACFFLMNNIYAPGDYAYCEGVWPDYYCNVISSYYNCP